VLDPPLASSKHRRKRLALALSATLLALSASCGDDSDSTLDSTPPDLHGDLRLTIDGETTTHEAICRDQPTAIAVLNYYGVPVRGEPVISINVGFTDASHDEVRSTDASIEDIERFAYVDGITDVQVSDDGLEGSLNGSGLLYEDSTTKPAELTLAWSCERA
jgi:hypothetical protein